MPRKSAAEKALLKSRRILSEASEETVALLLSPTFESWFEGASALRAAGCERTGRYGTTCPKCLRPIFGSLSCCGIPCPTSKQVTAALFGEEAGELSRIAKEDMPV